jgi:hypothetical protein
MSVRAWLLVSLGCSSLLVIPAACSGDSETGDGSGAAGATTGAGGDESMARPDGATPISGAGGGVDDANGAGAPAGGAAGATSEGGTTSGAGAGAGAGAIAGAGAGGQKACNTVVAERALANGVHVAACSDITYATNPPSSGEHYPTWADYGVYDFALPRGYWVHNLEHGSVVVSYNCEDGCPDELMSAKTWLAQLAPDAQCLGQTPRVLLVPDPLLDVRWAASAWGWTLRADCFDAEAFLDFYVTHAGKPPAPEAAICVTGTDFRPGGACGVK